MQAANVAAARILRWGFMALLSADDRDLAAHHIHRGPGALGLDQHDVAAACDHVAGTVAAIPLPGVEPGHSARRAAREVDFLHELPGLAEDADLDRGHVIQLVGE